MGRVRLVAGVVASVLTLPTPAVRLVVVTATALSAAGCEPQCTIDIVTPDPLPEGRVGSAYFLQFDATEGCVTGAWSTSDDLPPGMKLSKDGALDGVPTKDGTYTFAVAVEGFDASSASHVASRSYTLIIHAA